MDPKAKDVIATLQKLAVLCREVEGGLHSVAEHSHDTASRALFLHLWRQQAQFVSELDDKIRGYGGDPVPGPLAPEDVSGERLTERVLFTQCSNGEAGMHHACEEALKNKLPIDVRMLLQRQLLRSQEILGRLATQRVSQPLPFSIERTPVAAN